MSAHAQRLKLRLFIEGVEVPCIAAQVEARPNSPLVATIQIPPLAEGTRLHPRSLVHLFFLDFYASGAPQVATSGSVPLEKNQPPTTFQQELEANGFDLDKVEGDFKRQHYKLLFVGELVGFSWTKNPSNRSLVLQCLDPSNYWDYAYQWNNTDIFGPGVKALFSGGSTNLFTDFLTDEGSEILALLRRGSRTYPKLKGLLSGIVSVLEGIGGTYYTPKAIGGQNVFFSLAELRLHVTQMITAYEKDPTSFNLMNANGYDGLFGRTLGNLGAQVSFRQAINALQGMIFHETFAQPCPLYTPGTYGSVSGRAVYNLADVQGSATIIEYAKNLMRGQDYALEQLKDFASGNATAEDGSTGKQLNTVFGTGMQTGAGVCTKAIQEITSLRTKEFEKLKAPFTTGRTLLLQARAELQKNWDGGLPMPAKVFNKVSDLVSQAKRQFQRVVDAQIPFNEQKDALPARLNQQIFRPDVWFSAPPRCNVLFPDQYTSLNYTRAFLAEPTRFLLKTNDEFFGEDELFDNFFFAPKAPLANSKKQDPTLSKLLSNGVMDHELFTGILPVFEKMGELNIFAAQSGIEKGKQLKVGLAQRSTNFLYFKHRFSARQMQIQCRFNPYIACGFPGLILDRYVDIATLARHNELLAQIGQPTRQTRNLLGTHFLGNFTEITHSLSQQGATTNINVGYARQYEESVEFLGSIEKDQVVQQRIEGNAVRETTVACLNPPPVGSIGPNYGVVTLAIDVTNAFIDKNNTEAPWEFKLFRGPRRKPGDKNIEVPVGITKPAKDYGEKIVALVGSETLPVTFRAFKIAEEVPRYKQTVVDTPAEEYIRPGWYGPIWKPENIGQVYDAFFRTGAITDPTNITDPQGANRSSLADQAAFDEQNNTLGNSEVTLNEDTLNSLVSQLDPKSSIQQAVDFLVLTYSYIKQAEGVNVDDFIKAYTWRPIASMIDMFGTNDLTLSEDGSRVLSGFEGFHSRAFGQYENLFGLVTSDIESVLGARRDEITAQRLDTRKRKQDMVLDYVAALQLSKAILG